MNMGQDSKEVLYEQGEERVLDHRDITGDGYGVLYMTSFSDPLHTAVLTHLRAALKALDEHDCMLVEREIREAMRLL